MEGNNKGGKRIGAGRKKSTNPKIIFTLYIKRSDVLKFGNKEKTIEKIYDFVENYKNLNSETLKESTDQNMKVEWHKPEVGLNTPENDAHVLETELRHCSSASEFKRVIHDINTAVLPFFAKKNLLQLATELSKNYYDD